MIVPGALLAISRCPRERRSNGKRSMALFNELKASRAARAGPVCGSSAVKSLLVDQKIDWQRLNEFAFASRKEPELMSWRMVRCRNWDGPNGGEAAGSAPVIA